VIFVQPNNQQSQGQGQQSMPDDKLLDNKQMEEELNAIRNSLALILQSAIIKKKVPPQAQKQLVQRANRIVDRLQRRNRDDDDRQIIVLMMMLRLLEKENW